MVETTRSTAARRDAVAFIALVLIGATGGACVVWPAPAAASNGDGGHGFTPVQGVAPIQPAPTSGARVDLHVVDDTEWITVTGTRRAHHVPATPANDYAPRESEMALPRDIRIVPPNSCPNEAYQTIAGQPATANDLVGFLGSGACR
jgi:hypothetical protein